mmetsp:Transcript_127330/g.396314  ORF Transcript_127330/g.396314 Transcript_127330/m.396314 type:complete len:146 (-) Transcript_127330:458-895(-)
MGRASLTSPAAREALGSERERGRPTALAGAATPLGRALPRLVIAPEALLTGEARGGVTLRATTCQGALVTGGRRALGELRGDRVPEGELECCGDKSAEAAKEGSMSGVMLHACLSGADAAAEGAARAIAGASSGAVRRRRSPMLP